MTSSAASQRAAQARELVLRYGWNAMAYQILNPGIAHWFDQAGDGVVGYVDAGGVWVVAGAPICPPERLANEIHIPVGQPVRLELASGDVVHNFWVPELHPYPRLSAFAYWTTLFGGLLFFSSFLFGLAPDGGWYAYVPLTNIEFSPDRSMDFWLLGLNVAEIGAIAGAMELIISVLKLRGVNMTLSRISIFAWVMLVVGVMIIFAFTPLIVATTLLELDRKLGTQFFNPDTGGRPLLWQHLFWFFGHPDVYIQFLAPVGVISMVIPVFARRRLEGYTFVALAILATGFLSFGLWVHHMYTAGLSPVMLALFLVGVQNSVLSAMILAAQTPWYADHARLALLCNLAPLEDQRMAGLIMMLPCDLIYLTAVLWLGAQWLGNVERSAQGVERGIGAIDEPLTS